MGGSSLGRYANHACVLIGFCRASATLVSKMRFIRSNLSSLSLIENFGFKTPSFYDGFVLEWCRSRKPAQL
jgi:hypothetical protein